MVVESTISANRMCGPGMVDLSPSATRGDGYGRVAEFRIGAF